MIAEDVVLGNQLMIAGLPCEVMKKELVFRHKPNELVRLELRIIDDTTTARFPSIVIFFRKDIRVEVIA